MEITLTSSVCTFFVPSNQIMLIIDSDHVLHTSQILSGNQQSNHMTGIEFRNSGREIGVRNGIANGIGNGVGANRLRDFLVTTALS